MIEAGDDRLVLFRVDRRLHGIPLACVDRVLRAAALTPLPGAPTAVLGVLDLGGRLLPVVSLRQRLGLPERPLAASDEFLVVLTRIGPVGLVVDAVEGLAAAHGQVAASRLAPGLQAFDAVARVGDGLALVHAIERMLSGQEQQALSAALEAVQ